MLVFGHSGYPIILFPQARGRYYDYKDSGLINSVGYLLDNGLIKIYCPDSIDAESWYNYSIHPADRVKNHNAYESMILHDVIGFAQFETNAVDLALAGCGFGGYHAVNMAFRHPQQISYILSIDGFYNIKRFILGYYDDNCYFNNPPDYLPGLADTYFLDGIKKINILLSVGDNSVNRGENEELTKVLISKDIHTIFEVTEPKDYNSVFALNIHKRFSTQ